MRVRLSGWLEGALFTAELPMFGASWGKAFHFDQGPSPIEFVRSNLVTSSRDRWEHQIEVNLRCSQIHNTIHKNRLLVASPLHRWAVQQFISNGGGCAEGDPFFVEICTRYQIINHDSVWHAQIEGSINTVHLDVCASMLRVRGHVPAGGDKRHGTQDYCNAHVSSNVHAPSAADSVAG